MCTNKLSRIPKKSQNLSATTWGTQAAKLLMALFGMFLLDSGFSAGCRPPLWHNLKGLRDERGLVVSHGMGTTPNLARGQAEGSALHSLGFSGINSISTDSKSSKTLTRDSVFSNIRFKTSGMGSLSNSHGNPILRTLATSQSGKACPDGLYHNYMMVCRTDMGLACRLYYPSDGAAAFRASLLPGLGHIYKKRTKSGIGFLTAVTVPVAGGLMALGISNVYFKNSAEARSSRLSDEYRSRGYALNWMGIGALAIGCGIYIWNIFDALNCEGVPEFR